MPHQRAVEATTQQKPARLGQPLAPMQAARKTPSQRTKTKTFLPATMNRRRYRRTRDLGRLSRDGVVGFDPEEQAANLARQEQQVQELIAECMTREGFEYIPVTRPFDDFGFGAPGDVEFAADFGFGVTTYFGETESPWVEEDWVDPNQAIVRRPVGVGTKRILRHAARVVVQQRWLRFR